MTSLGFPNSQTVGTGRFEIEFPPETKMIIAAWLTGCLTIDEFLTKAYGLRPDSPEYAITRAGLLGEKYIR